MTGFTPTLALIYPQIRYKSVCLPCPPGLASLQSTPGTGGPAASSGPGSTSSGSTAAAGHAAGPLLLEAAPTIPTPPGPAAGTGAGWLPGRPCTAVSPPARCQDLRSSTSATGLGRFQPRSRNDTPSPGAEVRAPPGPIASTACTQLLEVVEGPWAQVHQL